MKTRLHYFFVALALLASLARTPMACGAVNFTVTPAAVSNTYIGPVTLLITGLNPGETVVVQEFADANANGVIDAGDFLTCQFNLTDGANFVIGGVTNINVPGDTDTTPGQITARLNFGGAFKHIVAGQYLLKLSSPTTGFTPVTNTLVVTNFPYPQEFTGTVVNNGTGVANAGVLIVQPSGNGGFELHGGAIADNLGRYATPVPAGTYTLFAFKSNYIASTTVAANLVLGSGATISTNLSLIAATQTISGRIFDTNDPNVGLPGFLVGIQSPDGLLASSFTDANGNFSAGVNADQWAIGHNSFENGLALHGYVRSSGQLQVDTSGGSVSNANLAVAKATALFYGTVTDASGNPFPVVFELYDSDSTYSGSGYTDTNGNYVAAALGGLGTNDFWDVGVDDFTNYIFSQETSSTSFNAGQAVLQDFTATLLHLQVTTFALPNGTNGLAYRQQLSAIYGQPPYSWALLSGSLPAGLTLATNGLLSGTPATGGTFYFTVEATDTLSATATQPLSMTVFAPPVIMLEPTNNSILVPVGGNVNLTVSVTGAGPFTYQWQLNGTNLPNGIITTVAGSGSLDLGDGGAATNAPVYPFCVAVDSTGDLFIADRYNDIIREVATNGIITTVAGNGGWGYSGDGSSATNAELSYPSGVAVDASGNLFIADSGNNVIRKVDTHGIITTIAGNGYKNQYGEGGYSGDGGTATNAELNEPVRVALDSTGNLFIADAANSVVRKVGTNGIIRTVAGNGAWGYTGDWGAATSAKLSYPAGVAVDAAGNRFIADQNNNVIREVDSTGIIYTVAGNGTYGYSGNGGWAGYAEFRFPSDVAVDTTGDLFIADSGNNVIRKVDTNTIITTVAGDGYGGYSGDGGAATQAGLNMPYSVAVDAPGDLFIADLNNKMIRKVDTNGIITTVAGNGYIALITVGYSGDGGAATNAELSWPSGVAVYAPGNLFIADSGNNVIRKVDTNGIITTMAGNGTNGYSGDGGAATEAELYSPTGVAVDVGGNLFIADSGNNVIRKVDTNGIITTMAGNGTNGYSGDGGAATNAALFWPTGVAIDASGNLFIADRFNNVIRKVATNGTITTLAGNGDGAGMGEGGYSGDGGAATNAELFLPAGVAVDADGNLFVADSGNNVVREVATNGIITTVAGDGVGSYSGDGSSATNAELSYPSGVAVDASGNLFIADSSNNLIRKVDTNGIIATVAGDGYSGFFGDGGAATNAELSWPSGVTDDAKGNMLIADQYNQRIRKIVLLGPTLVLNDFGYANAGTYDVVVSSPYGSVTSSVVTLTLTLPAVLSTPQVTANKANFTFQLSGPVGSNYVLQASTNLLNWSSVSTSTIPVSGSITLSNATRGYNRRFYRVYLQ
ncbi:exported hypothetical protein [Verrucomicrobia bacterium]|nr:exported hypothetical protein [Verrucomicrobiota bacterium]